MGSQSKHLKPVSWTPSTGTLENHVSARNRHQRTHGRTERAIESSTGGVRPRGSPTVQLLWDQPSSSSPRPPSRLINRTPPTQPSDESK